jgi:hypothetical protein
MKASDEHSEEEEEEDNPLRDVSMTLPEDGHVSSVSDDAGSTTIPEESYAAPVAEDISSPPGEMADIGDFSSTIDVGQASTIDNSHASTATLENPTPASALQDDACAWDGDFSEIASPRSDDGKKKRLAQRQEKPPNARPRMKVEVSGSFGSITGVSDPDNEDNEATSLPDDLKKVLGSDFDSPSGGAGKKQPKTTPLNAPAPLPKPGGVGLTPPIRQEDLDMPNLATTGPTSDDQFDDDGDSIFSS